MVQQWIPLLSMKQRLRLMVAMMLFLLILKQECTLMLNPKPSIVCRAVFSQPGSALKRLRCKLKDGFFPDKSAFYKLIVTLALLGSPVTAEARENWQMQVGDMRVLSVPDIARVA